ncbi:MAG: hypothetical protein NTZ09_10580 [Candidatus Hydrogenedentes bacterium]|nr:hypothetical protein [Candidatus Hydrogenedentota bacterium]
MRYLVLTIWSVFLLGAAATEPPKATTTYSIPVDKIDLQKLYYGNAGGFTKPGNVDYEAIIKATPEYDEVKKKKVEVGTGKYWILLSQASDRAVRAISEVGQETGYDLVAAQGYLGSLEPPIPADDITQLVLAKLTGKDTNNNNNNKKK